VQFLGQKAAGRVKFLAMAIGLAIWAGIAAPDAGKRPLVGSSSPLHIFLVFPARMVALASDYRLRRILRVGRVFLGQPAKQEA